MTIMISPSRLIGAITLAAALGSALAGCGSSHQASAGPVPTIRLQPVKPGEPAGPVVTEPTEGGSRPISAVNDSGQQVLILAGSVAPQLLVANTKANITWTNLTTQPQVVSFEQQPVSSGPIPPGGHWSYFAQTGANIHYRISTGVEGTIDFNPAL
jgi:hypothetical protein